MILTGSADAHEDAFCRQRRWSHLEMTEHMGCSLKRPPTDAHQRVLDYTRVDGADG